MQHKTFLSICKAQKKKKDKNEVLVDNEKGRRREKFNNQKGIKKSFHSEESQTTIAWRKNVKSGREMLLSIRNGSQTMHFHSYYAFTFYEYM